LPIVLHLPPEQIARRDRACRHAVGKAHRRVIWLMTGPEQPPSPAQAAAQVGRTPVWVRVLLKRGNAEGPGGPADRRRGVDGGRCKLTTDRRIDLRDAVQHAPPEEGPWTGPEVAAYVRDRRGIAVCKPTGWEGLHGLGLSFQAPRPGHPEAATPAERRAWKRRPGGAARRVAAAAPRQGRRAVGRG
jgi:transposase